MYTTDNAIKLIMILIAAFCLGALFTKALIPFLHKQQMGQNIREEGPEAHKKKAGTPSMGGVGIMAAVIICAIYGFISARVGGWQSAEQIDTAGMWIVICGLVGFGLLGFTDDYLKVIKKENEGLKVLPKFAGQTVIAAVLSVWVYAHIGGDVYIPVYGGTVDIGFWVIPFLMLTILAMVNAVNFTDGLDGLAGSVTVIVSFTIVVLAMGSGAQAAIMSEVFATSIMGACLGFLVFNHHPAKIFMGDTGSMALGGGITMAAVVIKMELFLPIIGIIYLLEVLSVCIQVTYFKKTGGKRIFRMTPLHHHFELGGMSENGVVGMFCAITAAACFIGALMA